MRQTPLKMQRQSFALSIHQQKQQQQQQCVYKKTCLMMKTIVQIGVCGTILIRYLHLLLLSLVEWQTKDGVQFVRSSDQSMEFIKTKQNTNIVKSIKNFTLMSILFGKSYPCQLGISQLAVLLTKRKYLNGSKNYRKLSHFIISQLIHL